ncbi:MAG: ral secretion pathway protein [Acidimicrobiales bacterium]|nr:ral secretion pathway protein [Acidimicrobiales bacterium]
MHADPSNHNSLGGIVLKHLQAREDWNEKSLGAKGFTLIELLVVIVILGILAAVVVFAVNGITDKGQTSACETDKKTLIIAVQAWNASPRVAPTANPYPTTQANLVSAELLDAPSTMHELTGGNTGGTVKPDVTAIAAGPC